MKNWIVNNIALKILSLVLAILVWFYISGELEKEELARGARKARIIKER